MVERLHRLPSSLLEKVASNLRDHTGPLTLAILRSHTGEGKAKAIYEAFQGMDVHDVQRVLRLILEDRQHLVRQPPEFVYTGPTIEGNFTSRTATELNKILRSAKKSVLIAGYSFDNAATIFKGLYENALENPSLDIRFFLNLEQFTDEGTSKPRIPTEREFHSEIHRRMCYAWPFDDIQPRFFYDARYHCTDEFISMHAKVVVIDDKEVLIGSANFTDRGHNRNLEIGVRLPNYTDFALEIRRHFDALVEQGKFVQYSK